MEKRQNTMEQNISQQEKLPTELQKLIDAAKSGEDEDWDYIDMILSEIRDKDSVAWAFGTGLSDENPDIRDLAASLIEDWEDVTKEQRETLLEIMESDEHQPVQLRIAAGEWKRGNKTKPVFEVLKTAEASDDEVMRDLAKELLNS